MDEASQLRLEEALGAIGRADQAVIVGDPKQLPPTVFFERLLDGDVDCDEMTAAEEAESILDVCQTCFISRRLRWHYRSEHEQLIAFSNSQFYENDLIVFPAPFQGKEEYGVKHHFIDRGFYQKGRNRTEAAAVALAVMDHFRRYPDLGLGVATFNIEQRDLIQDEVERLQKKEHWLEETIRKTEDSDQPFFIKNLENVQGTKGMSYSFQPPMDPDPESGQVYQRFGPLNLSMGWRRLNVIVTRAKKRLELFTSMKASDVRVQPGASRGVSALRSYIEYAESGKIFDFGNVGRREPESDFEIAVFNVLNQHGYKCTYQVGVAGFFIDIGVEHPLKEGEFILGVECDGATYHSAKSIRDRDLLRQKILESKGWRIYRIWSTDWFKNKTKEVDSLLRTLAMLVDSDRVKMEPVEADIRKLGKVTTDTAEAIDRFSEEEAIERALLEFREQRIGIACENAGSSILSDDLIKEFVERKPTTKGEFHSFPE